MKAIPTLTTDQPGASLIAFGLKTIETGRRRRQHDQWTHSRFNGLIGKTIAIHAGLEVRQWPNGQYPPEVRHLRRMPREGGYEQLDETTIHANKHLGCVVAIVDAQDYRWLTDADSAAALCPADGLYGLDLGNVRRFRKPISARGEGIWTWEPPEDWELLLMD